MPSVSTPNPAPRAHVILEFGPFRLDSSSRTLLRNGRPVRLPKRAWDILVELAAQPGRTVDERELTARVWPNAVVSNGALRAYISALRKALDDGESPVRYVENVNGMGYRLLASLRSQDELSRAPSSSQASVEGERLIRGPIPSLPQPIGRDDVLADLLARFQHTRLVTIVGTGGVGKTCVAVATARHFPPSDFSGISFVDLASLTDPNAVGASIAAALGVRDLNLSEAAADPLQRIPDLLQEQRVLLVLDNCEHLIESAAALVEQLLALAPGLHILATSRERLRARGESVLRLAPLELPSASAVLTAERALSCSAVKLFVQRAQQTLHTFELTDADAAPVINICRRLDGLPLAIELAAARLNVLGIHGLSAHLDAPLTLLTRGYRTAPARHRTLRAALDWSYRSLSPAEQAALCRLSMFANGFDIDSAAALLAGAETEMPDAFELVTSLADKSLLMSSVSEQKVFFRMLQTTRAYALEKLKASGACAAVKHRYAGLAQSSGNRRVPRSAAADRPAS